MKFKEFYLTEKKVSIGGKSYNSLKDAIIELDNKGFSIDKIYKRTGASVSTIKSYIKPKESESVDYFVIIEQYEDEYALVGVCTNKDTTKSIIQKRKEITSKDEINVSHSIKKKSGNKIKAIGHIAINSNNDIGAIGTLSQEEKDMFIDDGYSIHTIKLDKPMFIQLD